MHGGAHWRQALWILAAMTAARLALGVVVPLFPDETYYWDWSRQLAGGYFDHPPVIAFLIAGGTALLGETPIGVRLLPILAGTAGGFALVRTTCHLAGPSAARYASAVFAVIPLSAAGLVLATPDAPLLAGIAWTLYAVVRALDEPIGSAASTRWWSLAGLAVGVAMAAKFTGAFIPVGLLLGFAWHRPLRARLLERGPWIAVAIASAVMLPVLRWNSQHEWIAFTYQLGHALAPTARGTWYGRELELVGGQAVLLSPILFVLVMSAIVCALRAPRADARFSLAAIATFCLAFFVYSAIGKGVSANWPAIAWLPGIVLLGAAREGPRTAWERRGVWLSAALVVPILLQVVVPYLPLPPRRDQVNKAHGWDALALSVDSARRAIERATGQPEGSVVVAANRYQDASMLAYHMPGRPAIPALNLGGRPNQYEIWPTFTRTPRPGLTLLLVLELPREGVPGPIRRLAAHFDSITAGGIIPLRRGDVELGHRRLWMLSGWDGVWPDPRAPIFPP